jgi:predicted metal-dependent peptidase
MTASATAKSIVDSFRDVAQDLLVPELKALRVSVDSMRTEMQLRDEKTQESIRHLDLRTQESIRHLSEKLDFAIDIRERLAALEARSPRQ